MASIRLRSALRSCRHQTRTSRCLLAQSLYRSEQLIEGDCERDMAFSIYSALWAVNGVRSPQTNHSLLFLVRPKKNDVASRIAICKGQADNSSIKLPRQFGVRDRNMGFVEMHTAKASARSFLDQ